MQENKNSCLWRAPPGSDDVESDEVDQISAQCEGINTANERCQWVTTTWGDVKKTPPQMGRPDVNFFPGEVRRIGKGVPPIASCTIGSGVGNLGIKIPALLPPPSERKESSNPHAKNNELSRNLILTALNSSARCRPSGGRKKNNNPASYPYPSRAEEIGSF